MKPLEQEAQEIFEVHPTLKKIYITSDGIGYEREHDANQHAKTLEDKKVTKFERFVQEPSNKDKNPSNKEQETDDNGGQTKDEGNDELNEGDVNKEPSGKDENPSNKGQEPSNKDKNKKK
ncbi:hypothetical protein [Capnocytophaga felis]|uniref:Uncharacterized protein n=1 Tax=Capnocytophaga felis TaxID=2267611 RepID=A0A5M4BA67_9FLAO|nr:hypothetical protein [Capnocytophaga felis]GET46498.1 hypothetical protein RCZ01_18000 [Capnocytophaga felis]GET48388.1 hypothetical protein RCZ02_12190 [Capnocytophaga felis]